MAAKGPRSLGPNPDERKYQVEAAARSLVEAQKLKADKALHKEARNHLKAQHKAITRALKSK